MQMVVKAGLTQLVFCGLSAVIDIRIVSAAASPYFVYLAQKLYRIPYGTCRSIGTVVFGIIFSYLSCKENAGVILACRDFYIWVGLVVFKKRIVFRLILLYKIIF